MLNIKLLILLSFLTVLFAASIPQAGAELSNSQRLARGLGPNKPKRLYDASRVHAAPARRSVGPEDEQPQNIVVGSPSSRKRGFNLRYLQVLEGRLGSTSDKTAASLFIPPKAGNGVLRWVPSSNTGGFTPGSYYPMFATTDGGLSTLQFAPTLPIGALINLFSNPPCATCFAPSIGGSAVQWVMNSDGGMYMAPSLAIALLRLPGALSVLAQAFSPASTAPPSIDQAAGVAATVPTNPSTIWGSNMAGNTQGYLVCADNACSSFVIGPTTAGLQFYLPALGTTSGPQPLEIYQNGQIASLIYKSNGNLDSLSASIGIPSAVASLALFTVPTTGQGIITPQIQSNADTFMLAQGGRVPYICIGGQCAAQGQGEAVCLELVPPGGSPGACAQSIAQQYEQNPVQLYMTQLNGNAVTLTGWAAAGGGGITVAPTQSAATTFYMPNFANGGTQSLYANVNGVVSIAQMIVETISGGFGAQPTFKGGLTGAPGSVTSFLTLTALQGSVVTPSSTDLHGGGTWAWYYSRSSGTLALYSSDSAAQSADSSNNVVCIESVQPGQQPTGICKPVVQPPTTSFPICNSQPPLYAARGTPYVSIPVGDQLIYGGLFPFQDAFDPNDCLMQCPMFSRSQDGSCPGFVWSYEQMTCFILADPQYPLISFQPGHFDSAAHVGNELIYPGTCEKLQYQNLLSADVLATCCDNQV